MFRRVTILFAFLIGALLLSACTEEDSKPNPSREQETQRQQQNYTTVTENQPAEQLTYSPTRETINFWVETWGQEPGKLAYVYLQGANGEMLGYYILEGLPVSYCASISPTYTWENRDSGQYNSDMRVPAPAMDAVWYSDGQCNTFYGKDATSGSYIEYTAGLGINVLLYDQPLPRQDVEPLGPSTVDDVDEE